jgi:hypothetical protein
VDVIYGLLVAALAVSWAWILVGVRRGRARGSRGLLPSSSSGCRRGRADRRARPAVTTRSASFGRTLADIDLLPETAERD